MSSHRAKFVVSLAVSGVLVFVKLSEYGATFSSRAEIEALKGWSSVIMKLISKEGNRDDTVVEVQVDAGGAEFRRTHCELILELTDEVPTTSSPFSP